MILKVTFVTLHLYKINIKIHGDPKDFLDYYFDTIFSFLNLFLLLCYIFSNWLFFISNFFVILYFQKIYNETSKEGVRKAVKLTQAWFPVIKSFTRWNGFFEKETFASAHKYKHVNKQVPFVLCSLYCSLQSVLLLLMQNFKNSYPIILLYYYSPDNFYLFEYMFYVITMKIDK